MKKQSDSTIQKIMYWGCWVILAVLEKKEHTIHELQEVVCCRQANVSQHLSILRKEKLVETRKVGKQIYYSRNTRLLGKISEFKFL